MLTEAIELRNNNITAPIMILGYTPLYLGEDLINYDIEQTIYDLDYAKELSSLAISLNKKAKVHIALDTGMGRIGFLPNNESFNAICEICALDGLDVVGIFTHFSSSDEKDKEYTQYQFNQIYDFINKLENEGINIPLKHACNSAAIIDMPNTYLDSVRAGIILYGYYPSNEVEKENQEIKVPFDYGFVCLGMKAYNPLYLQLKDYYQDKNGDVLEIGDCKRARRIIEGTQEGRNIIHLLKQKELL